MPGKWKGSRKMKTWAPSPHRAYRLTKALMGSVFGGLSIKLNGVERWYEGPGARSVMEKREEGCLQNYPPSCEFR